MGGAAAAAGATPGGAGAGVGDDAAGSGGPLLNLPRARAVVDRAGRLREREGVVAGGEAAVMEAARKLEVLRKEVEAMLPQGGV